MSSLRVSTRLATVDPGVMAVVSTWRNVSLSGWPSSTATAKSPAGTSGGATGPVGEATGPAGVLTEVICSFQYHDPPVTGALVSAGARAGKASVVTQTPRVATTAQRLTKRTVLSPIGP